MQYTDTHLFDFHHVHFKRHTTDWMDYIESLFYAVNRIIWLVWWVLNPKKKLIDQKSANIIVMVCTSSCFSFTSFRCWFQMCWFFFSVSNQNRSNVLFEDWKRVVFGLSIIRCITCFRWKCSTAQWNSIIVFSNQIVI